MSENKSNGPGRESGAHLFQLFHTRPVAPCTAMPSRKKRKSLAASSSNNELSSVSGPSQLAKSKGSRGTRGKLSALLELPLDILLEVCQGSIHIFCFIIVL